jgi:hypothetical protein
MESFVESSGEVSLVSAYLLQGLIVRQQALPSASSREVLGNEL